MASNNLDIPKSAFMKAVIVGNDVETSDWLCASSLQKQDAHLL
jgi:hypothetical protein